MRNVPAATEASAPETAAPAEAAPPKPPKVSVLEEGTGVGVVGQHHALTDVRPDRTWV